MRALFLILADAAQVVEGKLYMLGGGWNTVFVDALPASRGSNIAIGLEVASDEVEVRHSFRLTLLSPGEEAEPEIGRGEFEVGRPPETPGGTEQRLIAAFPIVLQLGQQGRFIVRFYVDGTEMGQAAFGVVHRPQ